MRVLAVEDDAVYLSLLLAYVGRAGKGLYDVETVASLADGLSKLTQALYDVVLLDLQLPDSRGPATVTAVRRQSPTVPIVVLTSVDNEQTAAEVFENGAQEYLVKGKTNVNGVFRALKTAAERKGLSDKLRHLESAINECSDAIAILENYTHVNAFGPRISFVNQALCTQSGYSAAECLGKTWDVFFGPKTDPQRAQEMRASFEGVHAGSLEVVQHRKDGAAHVVSLKMTPVPDSIGYLSHWIIVCADVSDARRTEKARAISSNGAALARNVKDLETALATSEQRLRLLKGAAQDQMNMVRTLYETNNQLIAKVQTLLNVDEQPARRAESRSSKSQTEENNEESNGQVGEEEYAGEG